MFTVLAYSQYKNFQSKLIWVHDDCSYAAAYYREDVYVVAGDRWSKEGYKKL